MRSKEKNGTEKKEEKRRRGAANQSLPTHLCIWISEDGLSINSEQIIAPRIRDIFFREWLVGREDPLLYLNASYAVTSSIVHASLLASAQ